MFKQRFSKEIKLSIALILVLVVVALVGCGGLTQSNPLLGKWEMTSKYSAFSYELISGMFPGEILEFRPNGEVIMGSTIAQYRIDENNRLRVKVMIGELVYEFKISGDELIIHELGEPNLVMKFKRK